MEINDHVNEIWNRGNNIFSAPIILSYLAIIKAKCRKSGMRASIMRVINYLLSRNGVLQTCHSILRIPSKEEKRNFKIKTRKQRQQCYFVLRHLSSVRARKRFLQEHQIKAWGKTNLVCEPVVLEDVCLQFMWNVFYKWVFKILMLTGLQIRNLQCFAAFQSKFSIYYKR